MDMLQSLLLSLICLGLVYGDSKSRDRSVSCVSSDEPTYQPWSNTSPQVPLCEMPPRFPIPVGGQEVDLSAKSLDRVGTCDTSGKFKSEIIELDPDLGFPIYVVLPSVTKAESSCKNICKDRTTTGIHFRFKDGFESKGGIRIRVESPWFFVTGDEGASTACLSGKPSILEYGKPLSCAQTWVKSFGFATKELPDHPAVAMIDWRPDEENGVCCPYMCY